MGLALLDNFPLPAGTYSWGSPFGPRGGGFHPGQDLPAPTGTPLFAPIAAAMSCSWDPTGGGNWCALRTPAGDYIGLGHLSGFAHPGAYQLEVAAGELIGWVGTTGHSTGPHLHYAYRPAGETQYVDPAPLLRAAEAAGRFPNQTPRPPEPDVTPQELEDALNAHLAAMQTTLGQWEQDTRQQIMAAGLRGNVLTITEVRDLLAPLYEHSGLELPPIDVNSSHP